MKPTLTPQLALVYLRELSTDVRGGLVLDEESRPVAGDPRLEPGARALLEAVRGRAWTELRAPSGWVFVASFPGGALVLVTGPHALPGLVRHDMTAVGAMLAGAARVGGPRDAAPPAPGVAPADGQGLPAAAPEGALLRLAEGLHGALSPVGERLAADR